MLKSRIIGALAVAMLCSITTIVSADDYSGDWYRRSDDQQRCSIKHIDSITLTTKIFKEKDGKYTLVEEKVGTQYNVTYTNEKNDTTKGIFTRRDATPSFKLFGIANNWNRKTRLLKEVCLFDDGDWWTKKAGESKIGFTFGEQCWMIFDKGVVYVENEKKQRTRIEFQRDFTFKTKPTAHWEELEGEIKPWGDIYWPAKKNSWKLQK